MPRAGTLVRKGQMRLRVHALGGAKVLDAKVAVNGKVEKRVRGSRATVKVNAAQAARSQGEDRGDDPRLGRPPVHRQRSYRVAAKRR